MATITEIGTLISRRPEIRGGRPCIAGTGVSVRRIAQWHNVGLIPEEIARKFGHLSLAQVHAALAYYHANQDEIDRDLECEAREPRPSNNHILILGQRLSCPAARPLPAERDADALPANAQGSLFPRLLKQLEQPVLILFEPTGLFRFGSSIGQFLLAHRALRERWAS
jgi:uncharacterized protein (DUF433 family)